MIPSDLIETVQTEFSVVFVKPLGINHFIEHQIIITSNLCYVLNILYETGKAQGFLED